MEISGFAGPFTIKLPSRKQKMPFNLSFKERKCHQRKDIKTLYFIILQLKQFFFHDINDSIKFSTKEIT